MKKEDLNENIALIFGFNMYLYHYNDLKQRIYFTSLQFNLGLEMLFNIDESLLYKTVLHYEGNTCDLFHFASDTSGVSYF
jgi:hypothetical protein